MTALLVSLALWAALLGYTTDDTEIALTDSTPLVRCIVWRESRNEPYAVGRAGELGVAQLHPRGLLPDFRRWAMWRYTNGADPFSPYQSVEYLTHAISIGYGPQWSTFYGCGGGG